MDLLREFDAQPLENVGAELHRFVRELFPMTRSITGPGLRQTLEAIAGRIPLMISAVESGTAVLDWTIPREWTLREAWIKDPAGRTVVNVADSNLHVVNYSTPIRATLPLAELRAHLHSMPDRPEWIPYRTSYYAEQWGFCLAHRELEALPEGLYEVCIDADLEPGHLHYGECFLPGELEEEVLFSAHVCHPSLANDNLSGIAVAVALAEHLARLPRRRYSYRFVFAPGTIGAIAWLARNRERAARIRHGVVLTGIGNDAGFHYKKTRAGDAAIDRVFSHVLKHAEEPYELLEFSPYGYDERQYGSPGFDLAVGCLMRSVWGSFPQYHTSADNLEFVKPLSLARSLRVCLAAVHALENDGYWRNLSPFGEPQLGKYGLYRTTGGANPSDEIHARLWVLNQSDGRHSLLEIAERSGLRFALIRDAAEQLAAAGLLASEALSIPD